MTKREQILLSLEAASQRVGRTWPLYSFVASNPLSGYEKLPFEDAVKEAGYYLQSNTYPNYSAYKTALDNKDIDRTILVEGLEKAGFEKTPEAYLKLMASSTESTNKTYTKLDVIMTKWLAAFMDEGLAEWAMPYKEKGFFKAWKALASFDKDIGNPSLKHIPENSLDALEQVLSAHHISSYNELFSVHIAALPGWTGYIKHRQDTNSIWQQKFPISLEDYLAVRFNIMNHLGLPIETPVKKINTDANAKLKHVWLRAWEKTFQNKLKLNLVESASKLKSSKRTTQKPDAQMVFCIDTRSELIRRHVEAAGNYETFGYAGFFGIAADYEHYQEDISVKSSPPIVGSPYKIYELPVAGASKKDETFKTHKKVEKSKVRILKRLKNMLPSSFGFVEGSGVFYGLSLLVRSFSPKTFMDAKNGHEEGHEAFCEPQITYNNSEDSKVITLEEKVAIVKSGFDLMGWEHFSELVLFVGHGSQTSNNAFGSSLDCGACAANPGRHNARLLAAIANEKDVRLVLASKYNINIPEKTRFIGAEHNTTTDEIILFDAHVPSLYADSLKKLKANLEIVQKTATAERLGVESAGVELAKTKAINWSETRPEWGLAKNAAFIVGSRKLTLSNNLNGRCFMHSYNWKLDPEGKALEGIMGGPMVVTQWINNHYYFSTVDNQNLGGGSKITHNVTGHFGVVQGNGGDLKMGLPLQSLKSSDTEMYHQPLRLTTIIHAPLDRVESILRKNRHLQMLLDNEWMYLKVMDSTDADIFKMYQKGFNWTQEYGLQEEKVKDTSKVVSLQV